MSKRGLKVVEELEVAMGEGQEAELPGATCRGLGGRAHPMGGPGAGEPEAAESVMG